MEQTKDHHSKTPMKYQVSIQDAKKRDIFPWKNIFAVVT